MKTLIAFRSLLVAITIAQLVACNKAEHSTSFAPESRQKEEQDYQASSPTEATADTSTSPYYLSSSAAKVKDKEKDMFIRTADMKFKVKNVYAATIFIENITAQLGGYVSYTQLASEKGYVEYITTRKDSTIVLTPYTVTNTITLKVPNDKLDSALRSFVTLSEFLDYRTITATDMTLTLSAEQQKQQRLKQHNNRLGSAIDRKASKLGETNQAEDNLLNRQQELDNSQLNSQAIRADIAYSTVKLQIYQNPKTTQEIVAKEPQAVDFAPTFFEKMGDAFIDSIKMLETFVIFLLNIWWIILLLIGSLALFRYIAKTMKSSLKK
jgi:hypothetical protein